MPYRPASDKEAEAINSWFDSQHFHGPLRELAWVLLESHAKNDDSAVYQVYEEQRAKAAAKRGPANDVEDFDHLPLADGGFYNATAYLKTIDDPADRARMARFFNAEGSLLVMDAYDIYFGDTEMLSPELRRERMDFFNRQEHREYILQFALGTGDISDPNDFDAIEQYMRHIADNNKDALKTSAPEKAE